MPPNTNNVVVIGLDDVNLRSLAQLFGSEAYRFWSLLTIEDLQGGHIDFEKLLATARARLAEYTVEVHAIVGYWDFPVSCLVAILCEERGLHHASLEAIVKAEHKYWSRLEQRKVIDNYPAFGLVHLAQDTTLPGSMGYPAWLKPVKSFSSELAFYVVDDEGFAQASAEIKQKVGRIGDAFDQLLDYVELPAEIAETGGQACLAEEAVSGALLTIEGYAAGGQVHTYGAIDSVTYPESSSFLRYQYPSTQPAQLIARASDISRRVIKQIGLSNVAFNIEYFVRPETGDIVLLEINPRHSQSHALLFAYVDGRPNHQAMVRLGLGLDPQLPFREGPYATAAKWSLRRFSDAKLTRLPTDEDIEQVQQDVPGSVVSVITTAGEGQWLSEVGTQDSYSYELAEVFVGGETEDELHEKYERAVAGLGFSFAER